jgi:Protein of unknown function (DUF4232)
MVSSSPALSPWPRRTMLAGLTAAVAVLLAACGGSDAHQASATVPTSTTVARSTTTATTAAATTATTRPATTSTSSLATTTTTTIAAPTTNPPITTCQPANLEIGFQEEAAGIGHFGAVLVFTNHGSVTCTMDGYVGLRMFNAQNAPLPTQVTQGSGDLFTDPGPSLVTLTPGGTASAGIEWRDVPTTSDPSTGCPTSATLQIAPPGAAAATTISAAITACGLGAMTTTAVQTGAGGPST